MRGVDALLFPTMELPEDRAERNFVNRPAQSRPKLFRTPCGFTLIELMVVLAIISILASLLMPTLSLAKEKARAIVCVNNLKQIGISLHIYADDHSDYLVPAEYNKINGAPFQEGWPTILTLGKYLDAPRSASFNQLPLGKSVFRCPSGMNQVYAFNPASRDDREGAKAYPYVSESTGTKFYVDCWYGINAGTGDNRWPFLRVPLDSGKTVLNKMASVAPFASSMPAVFDGFWVHNGKDERVNARHTKNTRTNLSFFDGSASSFDTFRLPSVRATNSMTVRWRY